MTSLAFNPPFWTIVEKCLIEFQNWGSAKAEARVAGMVAALTNAPGGIDPNLVYHEEPYLVACRLAGKSSQSLAKNRARYDEIVAAAEANPKKKFAGDSETIPDRTAAHSSSRPKPAVPPAVRKFWERAKAREACKSVKIVGGMPKNIKIVGGDVPKGVKELAKAALKSA